jgi:hypothetical protein
MSTLHNAHALGIQAPMQGAWAWAHVLGMWDRAPYPSLYSWGVFGFFFFSFRRFFWIHFWNLFGPFYLDPSIHFFFITLYKHF